MATSITPQNSLSSDHLYDAVIVGGGPSGSSCAYWLARSGWDVAVLERKDFPRAKTCGDGLTPRSVRQIADMGIEAAVAEVGHRYEGLRSYGFGQSIEMKWPDHPSFPSHGYCITRFDLDALVAENASSAGASVFNGVEAVDVLEPTAPSIEGQLMGCAGLRVKDKATGDTHEIRGRIIVVADGANSRIGRSLGAQRRREWPMGMAIRGYYESPMHDDPFIESHLDIRDAEGNVVPGYGWIFPLGDGRVNVGVGLLSTDRRWKGINTSKLMDTFVDFAPDHWGISKETALGSATGGKLPMGFSVGPHTGTNVITIGDASGSINPFNGEGIAYGYETGRLAAASIAESLQGGGYDALRTYDERLTQAYGAYYDVARAFVRLISEPKLMALCVGVGMRSETLMSELLSLMANLLRPDERGPAEVGFRALAGLGRILPDRALEALFNDPKADLRSVSSAA
ncbi:MAG: geranylgeranyl reductase family protein [Actinomycetes bacterium]